METNNNNELRLQAIDRAIERAMYNHLYKSIADTIHAIIAINDISIDNYPLPVINYIHSILSINLVTIPCMISVFEILITYDCVSPILIENIRKEMNI